MTKLDILMIILGVASYIAIMAEMRSHEQKMADFDIYQEKRRVYLQHMNRKRMEERSRKETDDRKEQARRKVSQSRVEGAAEQLGSSDV